ncbi:MAG: XdhC family protein [Chloroflexota bacterium]|nr:XdhC family protein [Chloroflexota bacterium]
MRELLPTIAAWRADGAGFGRAVLIRAFGSAPRPPGATLLVADDGRLAGSVSGGCVEGACVEEVQRARRSGSGRVVRYGISDQTAWSVGLACGSTIDVLIEPEVRLELIEAAQTEEDRVVVTRLPADAPGDGNAGTADLAAVTREALADGRSRTVTAADGQYFVEVFARRPRLVAFGAVDIAMSLVRLAHELGYRVAVVDARPAFATAHRFPDADELLVGWPDELADQLRLQPADAVAVLTHDPKLDDPAIVLAVRAGCRYVGAIGSRRTQAARRQRLRAGGLSEADLAHLRGPIGLDLGGREPAEVALAIMAQIVASRYGARGGPFVG